MHTLFCCLRGLIPCGCSCRHHSSRFLEVCGGVGSLHTLNSSCDTILPPARVRLIHFFAKKISNSPLSFRLSWPMDSIHAPRCVEMGSWPGMDTRIARLQEPVQETKMDIINSNDSRVMHRSPWLLRTINKKTTCPHGISPYSPSKPSFGVIRGTPALHSYSSWPWYMICLRLCFGKSAIGTQSSKWTWPVRHRSQSSVAWQVPDLDRRQLKRPQCHSTQRGSLSASLLFPFDPVDLSRVFILQLAGCLCSCMFRCSVNYLLLRASRSAMWEYLISKRLSCRQCQR